VPIRTEADDLEPPDRGASKAAAPGARAGTEESNEFDRLLARAAAEGTAAAEARKLVFEAYLKGKPNRTGEKKRPRSGRDAVWLNSRQSAQAATH